MAAEQTSFTYDGLDRRVAITSVPAGGGAGVTRSFVWCGADICQARNAGNAVTRALAIIEKVRSQNSTESKNGAIGTFAFLSLFWIDGKFSEGNPHVCLSILSYQNAG